MKNVRNEKGQIILLLVLVMTVALAIGLSVIERSLSDISTSTKVEQSSRAFSAAEAGIENALQSNSNAPVDFNALNQSSATITGATPVEMLPLKINNPGEQQKALEYPPLPKEDVAHIWLADLNSLNNPPTAFYTQPTLIIYWGDPASSDNAALELTLVYYNNSQYINGKLYLDQVSRTPPNNFINSSADCTGTPASPIIPPGGSLYKYKCKKTIDFSNITGFNLPVPTPIPATSNLMLIRARLLYNGDVQPFAVQAITCVGAAPCTGYSLPPQQKIIDSTGIAGVTQRKVRVFQESKVVPYYFDYAIFSAGDITKN